MNTSTITKGIVIALLLNLANPVQAGWFSDWFKSRGAKATLAAGALASALGLGYLIYTWNKKKPKKNEAPMRPASKRAAAAAKVAPSVPGKKQAVIDRLAKKGIAQPTLLIPKVANNGKPAHRAGETNQNGAPSQPSKEVRSPQELAQAETNAAKLSRIAQGNEFQKKAAELQESRDKRKAGTLRNRSA